MGHHQLEFGHENTGDILVFVEAEHPPGSQICWLIFLCFF